jgi:hypothetical protein
MNGHDEYLELLAASIDFGLTEEEVARVNYHLASCAECRRAATELRGQNAVIATTPIPALAPARSEQILRAAMRKPAARPRWGMLAVAALLATLAGGVALAGLRLVDNDPAPSEPPPSLLAEASVPPSTAPVEESADPGAQPPDDGPRVTPNPGVEGPPDTDPINFEFPLPYSPEIASIHVAPLADGRLWVSFSNGDGTVLALLDSHGVGSPMAVDGDDCVPLAVADGSVRLLCAFSDEDPETCVDVCYEDRVYAYSPDFDELPGFPVSLPTALTAGVDRRGARVVGTNVVLGYLETTDDPEGQPVSTTARLITVRDDGTLEQGAAVEGIEVCCAISLEGIGYGDTVVSNDDGTQMSTIFALDPSGMVSGWPVEIEGNTSRPGFGPAGDLYFTSWIGDGSRLVRIREASHSMSVDLQDPVTWDARYDGPMAPVVGDTGRTLVVVDDRILSFDGTGEALPGWPYEVETGFVERGACGPQDTGCQPWIEPPRLAPRGLIYALETPPEGQGERITAVNADGSIRSGWPKTLQREGASWDSVTIAENRIAYAVAIEPEPNDEASISILAFAPNGTREWIRVLVEP